jgi:hypothetical protein
VQISCKVDIIKSNNGVPIALATARYCRRTSGRRVCTPSSRHTCAGRSTGSRTPLVPAKAVVPTAGPGPCRVREVPGGHAPAYRLAPLVGVVCTRTGNLPPFCTEPTRSATAKVSTEEPRQQEPRQLVPNVQHAHQRRAIHEKIASLVLGKHSSGVIHEDEQVDVRDVIAAPVC